MPDTQSCTLYYIKSRQYTGTTLVHIDFFFENGKLGNVFNKLLNVDK